MQEIIPIRCQGVSVDLTMDMDDTFPSDIATKQYNESHGFTEPEVFNVMRHVLRDGDTVIDGGANVGYFSLAMAYFVGEYGAIYSFEPGLENAEKFRKNAALNKWANLHLVNHPLSNIHETANLYLGEDSGMHTLGQHSNAQGIEIVETTTIDAFRLSPKLIKLDVEGSEINALIGGIETIASHKPFVVCELNETALNLFGRTAHDLRKYAKDTFGYDTFLLFHHFEYPVFVPQGVEIITPIQNMNVLFATVDMVAKYWPEMQYG